MNIRLASPEDARLLARIHVDSWRAAYRELVPAATLEKFTYEWREACFREALSTGAEETYLVEQEGDTVGILTLGPARDPDLDAAHTGEIWGIYLLPSCWRRGIGRRLVEEAEAILKSRGNSQAVLWVLADNLRARRFYEAMGYVPDGETMIIDWGTPLQAVRYWKDLPVVASQHLEAD